MHSAGWVSVRKTSDMKYEGDFFEGVHRAGRTNFDLWDNGFIDFDFDGRNVYPGCVIRNIRYRGLSRFKSFDFDLIIYSPASEPTLLLAEKAPILNDDVAKIVLELCSEPIDDVSIVRDLMLYV